MNAPEPEAKPTIELSVVVASKVGSPFIDQCLESILPQAVRMDAEVFIVAAGPAAYASRLAVDFPEARVIHAADIRKVPALRRRGVTEAKGKLIAVIEEHCSAREDWLQQALRAHSSGDYSAVGGPIVDDSYDRLRDWVVYFLEYNGSLPPAVAGETTELNDANIVYQRTALTAHLDLLDEGYWPMVLHPTLLARGAKFLSVPEMVVYHRGPFDFGYYLRQRFLFSRAYAGVRAQNQRPVHRMAYIFGAPLMPFVLLARMALRVLRKRHKIGQFVRALPLTIPALVVMVAGEWVGCVFGPGHALAEVE